MNLETAKLFIIKENKDRQPILPLKTYSKKYVQDRLATGTVLNDLDDADAYHFSYAYYLGKCWAYHLGAVVSAEFLWFTALTTFARMVKQSPELYRSYFVDFENQKKLP